MTKTLIARGHALVAEGAVHSPAGTLITVGGGVVRYGPGLAKCTCGALSPELPSGKARQRWHRDHKDEVRAARGAS